MPVASARIAAICAAALLFSALPARTASTIVFTCTGTIEPSSAGAHDFGPSVGPNTPFAATFALDSTATDLATFDPNGWLYIDHNPLNEAYIQFGDYSLMPDPTTGALNSLSGANNSGGLVDAYEWASYNSAGSGLTAAWIYASIQDNTGTALTGKGLPPAGPGLSDISRWDSSLLVFAATNTATGLRSGWAGRLTSISTRIQEGPIPEPGSLALLGAGLSCLAGWRKRRR